MKMVLEKSLEAMAEVEDRAVVAAGVVEEAVEAPAEGEHRLHPSQRLKDDGRMKIRARGRIIIGATKGRRKWREAVCDSVRFSLLCAQSMTAFIRSMQMKKLSTGEMLRKYDFMTASRIDIIIIHSRCILFYKTSSYSINIHCWSLK